MACNYYIYDIKTYANIVLYLSSFLKLPKWMLQSQSLLCGTSRLTSLALKYKQPFLEVRPSLPGDVFKAFYLFKSNESVIWLYFHGFRQRSFQVSTVTVQFERCFRLMEHIFVISWRNPINLYITEKLIKLSGYYLSLKPKEVAKWDH